MTGLEWIDALLCLSWVLGGSQASGKYRYSTFPDPSLPIHSWPVGVSKRTLPRGINLYRSLPTPLMSSPCTSDLHLPQMFPLATPLQLFWQQRKFSHVLRRLLHPLWAGKFILSINAVVLNGSPWSQTFVRNPKRFPPCTYIEPGDKHTSILESLLAWCRCARNSIAWFRTWIHLGIVRSVHVQISSCCNWLIFSHSEFKTLAGNIYPKLTLRFNIRPECWRPHDPSKPTVRELCGST